MNILNLRSVLRLIYINQQLAFDYNNNNKNSRIKIIGESYIHLYDLSVFSFIKTEKRTFIHTFLKLMIRYILVLCTIQLFN